MEAFAVSRLKESSASRLVHTRFVYEYLVIVQLHLTLVHVYLVVVHVFVALVHVPWP